MNRFATNAARLTFERMMRHNPRLAEMQELRHDFEPYRRNISRTETGKLYNNVIERCSKEWRKGKSGQGKI